MSETQNNQGKSALKKSLKRVLLILSGFFALIVILITVFIFSVVGNLPPLSAIENPQLDLSTQLYTADGKFMGNIHNRENRIYVHLNQISKHVKNALIATEDIRFDKHSGIDPKSLFAIAKDILTRGRPRGGSTITQQLARNLYDEVGSSKTITRKFKEAIVAIVLESRFTKDEIMQAYLNTTSFYGNTYGIELGAKTLFNKSAKDLNIKESALMVGLLKGPSQYNPVRHPDRAIKRRNTVLDQMVKYGKLSAKKARKLKKEDLGLDFTPGNTNSVMAPYFRQEVKRFLKKWIKENKKDIDLYRDGLRVYTTIDSRLQKYAERAVKEHLSGLQQTLNKDLKKRGYPTKKKTFRNIVERAVKRSPRYRILRKQGKSKAEIKKIFNKKLKMRIWTYSGVRDTMMSPSDSIIHYLKFLESGMMSMDPHSGKIRAYVGGINYDYFKYDHVSVGKRQVGSTFKPFVYAAAMSDERFKPCDPILDIPVVIELPDGRRWTPRNSGGKHVGMTTILEALATSKNQVTASLIYKLGADKVCELARRLGISSPLDCVPSIALGTSDLTVYEMVNAYAAFANTGYYVKPYFISRIEDKYGNILATFQPDRRRVMDPQTAFIMTHLMMGVVDHPKGTGARLRYKYKFKNQIAGKTGTTQNHSDGWFMGMDSELVTGVWVGCADRRIRFRSIRYGQGANMALPIWAIYMKYAYNDKDIGLTKAPFQKPEKMNISLVCNSTKRDTTTRNNRPEFWDD